MKLKTYIILSLMMIAVYAAITIVQVQMHERLHQLIYADYNISTWVEYRYSNMFDVTSLFSKDMPPLGVTYAERACPTEICNMQHNLLEIVEYSIDMTIALVFIFCSIFLVYKLLTDEDKLYDEVDKKIWELTNQQ